MTSPIRQKVLLSASPTVVFEYLTDSKKHAAFTGGSAKMSAKVGASVSAFSGFATGKNIEIIPNQKIVQTWHASILGWPEDQNSTLTITLQKVGKKTELVMVHENVPAFLKSMIANGWKEYYWNPLKEYLENQTK